jgi:Flp pilus assembly protein TadG
MIAQRFIRDQSGSSAIEFAMILPLLLIFLFGIIDAGRWMWTYNEAEKATQMGARFAIVANPVTTGLNTSFVGVSGLTQGDVIPASAFGKVTCTGTGSGGSISASCLCTTSPCPGGVTTTTASAFQNVLARMQRFLPQLAASNVTIEYSSSGLGYAGSPVLPDLSPLVTVKVSNMTFKPLTTFALVNMPMPSFTSTLTAEDLNGSVSN